MSTLTWSDELALNLAPMDRTHREFVEYLALLEQTLQEDPEQLPLRFDAFLAHTEAHFAQEERWMASAGFAAENCHVVQHRHVLDVLHEVKGVVGTTGDAQILRQLLAELGTWFTAHAALMDRALAETLLQLGFDPATGTLARAPQGEAALITGCGSASCA
jgi:hemerythrin